MKDGGGAGEPTEVSRQELYEAYVNCYVQPCTEVQPCRDAELMKKATQYLLREPRSRDAFTVFPFYQAVGENCDALGTDCRTHLSAFIKATELLEIICVNLFLQPWKKEIRTLKTFTGPFVYCLLPVLSSSTLKSVLASIGYLPYTDTPQSEFRLRDDPNPDRAMKLGFELLLARVQCSHFLELLEKDQLGPVEWLEVLQREGSTKLEEPTDKTTTIGQKEEEKKEEEADRKEVPLYLDSRLAMTSQPKPRHLNLLCVDHSIMEMQRIYPDLAFRGRPLVSDKPHQANSSRSSSKDAHTAMGNYGDDGKVAELCKADCIKGTKAAATAVGSRSDSSKAGDVFCDDGRSRGCNDGSGGWSTPPGNTASSSFSHTDGSRVDEELSGPQAISLHITLRAGSKAEPSLKPGECQATAEPPAWTQEQATAGNTHTCFVM
uniref:Spermatogenesis-associated protein 2 PUB-like domain-containing protein n=1 Tax=Monopterus albus TaxID=43700 RepID=A0A3Q3JJG5_MONAL